MTHTDLDWQTAADAAANRIAPSWPLDSLLASSPYWGLRDMTFAEANHCLQRLAGSGLHLNEAHYRRQYDQGRIAPRHLAAALREYGTETTLDAWLNTPQPNPTPAARLQSDWRDDSAGHAGMQSWRQVITQQISQCCAAWFDHDQADWQPDRGRSLYRAWLDEMALQPVPSRNAALKAKLEKTIATLPKDPTQLIRHAMSQLQPAQRWLTDWLHALLLRNSGWAAWCRFQLWQAELAGRACTLPQELLAVQLAWECLLDDGERTPDSCWHRWQTHWPTPVATSISRELPWQRAAELAAHEALLAALPLQDSQPARIGRDLHAVFCIDVRSEPMRQALEQTGANISTAGFAGFFGLPLAIRFSGETHSQPRLPGLLAPSWEALAPPLEKGLHEWNHFQRAPLSSFTLVESAGLGKAGKLLRKAFPSKARATLSQLDPWLNSDDQAMVTAGRQLDTDTIVAILLTLLPAMGLGASFPRTVLLIGHASHSSNNPQASALQCGACGGHGGHLHVLLLSDWLQRPAVRAGLDAAGLPIPDDTLFLPALHLTHSDELRILPTPQPEQEPKARAHELRPLLDTAERLARARRAGKDGVPDAIDDPSLLTLLRQKGHHWAETRPEWGLANNAFFIAAPRSRTAALNLDGRAFLQEYDWRSDPDARQLGGILGGPLVVAHWINMQYFASVADPERYGSGNKLLHNVVGGRIGVFEGNSGDLRIGLSLQSVHDGERWRHEPLRLAACIDAPARLMELALQRQPEVARLAANGWLHLYRIDAGQLQQWVRGEWRHPFASADTANQNQPDANRRDATHV